jgi:hypothetical protein
MEGRGGLSITAYAEVTLFPDSYVGEQVSEFAHQLVLYVRPMSLLFDVRFRLDSGGCQNGPFAFVF